MPGGADRLTRSTPPAAPAAAAASACLTTKGWLGLGPGAGLPAPIAAGTKAGALAGDTNRIAGEDNDEVGWVGACPPPELDRTREADGEEP